MSLSIPSARQGLGDFIAICPVCGGDSFSQKKILWPELIEQWGLEPHEVDYIELQQGFRCSHCRNNLRSMTLAEAVLRAFDFSGNFSEFCRTERQVRERTVIEVNAAGTLSPYLQCLPGHSLHCFPRLDLQRMSFSDDSVDILIHSDTLEHVPDAKAALQETLRVLRPGGFLFYTIPIVVGRLGRSRHGLPPSYHGKPGAGRTDYVVQWEYGADFWCEIFEAGFEQLSLTSLVFPASVAIAATKPKVSRVRRSPVPSLPSIP